MKQRSKYLIVLVLFIIVLGVVLVFFMKKYENINVINKANNMLGDLYNFKSGEYKLKNGVIVSPGGSVISKKYYFDGNGVINIDEYGNVRFNIDYKDKCVSKTYMGKTHLEKDKCGKFKKISVEIIKNNSKISFISNTKNLSYKVSYKDDFKGIWNSIDTDNLLLKYYREGKNYIWFKDEYGNLSERLEFEVECLDAKRANYKKDVFYCSGSLVVLDNIDWVVIEDTTTYTKLMKYHPLEEKMSNCFNTDKGYCFYNKTYKNTYDFNNSYIKYYLNDVFINKLSEDTLNRIINNPICNDYISKSCDNEICVGYTKEEIEHNNFECNSYSYSRVKLISYDEYNYVYARSKDRKVINGNYWAINSYEKDKGSSIQYNYDFYILENLTNKLDVKPVIILAK